MKGRISKPIKQAKRTGIILLLLLCISIKSQANWTPKSIGANLNYMGKDYVGAGANHTSSFLFLAAFSANVDYYKGLSSGSDIFSINFNTQLAIFTFGAGVYNEIGKRSYNGETLNAGVGILPFFNMGVSWKFTEEGRSGVPAYFFIRVGIPLFINSEGGNELKSIFSKDAYKKWTETNF